MTKTKAIFELLIAGLFWGFGFIGTIWCLRFLSPSAILFYRFFIAFFVGFVILLLQKKSKSFYEQELKIAFWPGLYLWLTLIFQTWALKYTTATNSTFITTLYVVMVPLLNSFLGKEKIGIYHWLCVLLAFIGTGFIVEIQKISELNIGDFLTLICSVFATVHIISIGIQTQKTRSDLALNSFQGLWVAFFSLLLLPLSYSPASTNEASGFLNQFQGWSLTSGLDEKAWIGILVLGFGSSLLAFYFQVRAQKVISPSVVSLMFLLESPMSSLFAYFLLGEKLSGWQWFGAGLIMLSCLLISAKEINRESHASP